MKQLCLNPIPNFPGQCRPSFGVDRTASSLLVDFRQLKDRYDAERCADPAEGAASVVRGWVHRVLTEILGWPPTVRRPLAAGLCASTALAYACPGDDGRILVHALGHGHDSSLDPRTARSAGYRWLIESDVASWHVHDLVSLHCLSMDSDRDVGILALLSEMRFGPDLAAGLEALSEVAAVRAVEPSLLGYLMDRHREEMACKLMDYAEGRGIAFKRTLGESLLADGHSLLDILALQMRDLDLDGGAPEEGGPSAGAAADTASMPVESSDYADRYWDDRRSIASPEDNGPRQSDATDLVYERVLITKKSRRPMVSIRVRAFKRRGYPVRYELLPGSGIAIRPMESGFMTGEAERIFLEERHPLLLQAGVRPVAPDKAGHTGEEGRYCKVARYVTRASVIASGLGAIIKATIRYKKNARCVFVDEATGRPVSQHEIEAEAEATEQTLNAVIPASPLPKEA